VQERSGKKKGEKTRCLTRGKREEEGRYPLSSLSGALIGGKKEINFRAADVRKRAESYYRDEEGEGEVIIANTIDLKTSSLSTSIEEREGEPFYHLRRREGRGEIGFSVKERKRECP